MTGLSLRLGADPRAFVSGVKSAESATRGLSSASRELTGREKALLGATTALAAGTAYLLKQQIDAADAASKMSDRTGLSTEAITGYSLATKLAGTNNEALATAFAKLSKGLLDAQKTGVGPTAEALDALGISAVDASGKIRPVGVIVEDIADRFATMENGATKTALAQELLGRSGVNMITLLNGGSEAIRRARFESEELGLVWSEDTAQSAEDLNDAIERLKSVADGFFSRAAQFYVPVLADIADGAVIAAKRVLGLRDAQSDGGRAESQKRIQEKAEEIAAIRAAVEYSIEEDRQVAALTGSKSFLSEKTRELTEELNREKEAFKRLKEEIGADAGIETEETKRLRAEAARRAEALAKGSGGSGGSGVGRTASSAAAAPTVDGGAALRMAAVSEYEAALRSLEDQERRTAIAALEGGPAILANLEMERRAVESLRDSVISNEALAESERVEIRRAANDVIVGLEHEAHREIFELRRQAVEEARQAEEDRIRATERANLEAQGHAATTLGAIADISQFVTDGIAANLNEQSAESKKAAKVQFVIQQALAAAIAAINMFAAIGQANASAPPPANIPAIAAATATGTATLVGIAATTIAGVADGGLPPGALARAGLGRHTAIAVRNDEVVLPPGASKDMEDTMAIAKRATGRALSGSGQVRVSIDSPIYLGEYEVGRFIDDHLVRSAEMGEPYGDKIRTEAA